MTNPAASSEKADFVFTNIKAWQTGLAAPEHISLAVRDGLVARIGRPGELSGLIGPATQVYDIPGGLLMPGLCDAHMHPLMGGQALLECDLSQAKGHQDCLATIKQYVRDHPEKRLISGAGWHDGDFPSPGPGREDLDAIEARRPVLLYSIDRHSLWANSRAMELAGINGDTPDPAGGVIERRDNGQPAGALREWSAMALVEKIIPKPDLNDKADYAQACFDLCARSGLTALHDAMVDEDSLRVYHKLLAQGNNIPFINASILCQPEQAKKTLEQAVNLRSAYSRPGLRVETIKFFMDGVTEGHTAWLAEPYADRPGFHGEAIWSGPEFIDMVKLANRLGFQIHIHTIGDAAIDLALTALEAARDELDRPDFRPELAHLDLITDQQINRMKKCRVGANLQPAWFYKDSVFDHVLLPALGPERANRLYPLKSILQAGIPTAFSSDWPASGDFLSLNPMDGIQIGSTRKPIDQPEAEPWLPAQIASVAQLAAGYTSGGAWSMARENQAGQLKPGLEADLVVLDQDIFAINPTRIASSQILLTMRQGRLTWRK